jgi:hypothetical protein
VTDARRPPRLPRATALTALAAAAVSAFAVSCAPAGAPDPRRDAALSDTLTALIVRAYDLSRPDAVARLMALYPTSGPVVSAAAGRVTTTRAALETSISRFWQRVGQNMVQPRFLVGQRYATSLGPDAAVLTLTYSIPHHTPEGLPHTLAGAWTAVFVRREGRWVIVQEHLSDLPPVPTPTDSTRGTQ